jgi:group 4 capsule polysaccharide lipoprotein GfcB/YjbF
MRIHTLITLLLASAVLAACSSENPKVSIGKNIPSILKELKLKKQTPQSGSALAGLTRAQLEGIKGPLLVAQLEAVDAFSTLSLAAQNRDVKTFFTPDQISVSLQNGILISTRGLSEDLMSADVSAAAKAIPKSKAANYGRLYRWLDGEDRQLEEQFRCDLVFIDTAKVEIVELTHRARHMQETCTSQDLTIVNDYWVGIDKPVIWQSRQWIGPTLGYLGLTVLVPE